MEPNQQINRVLGAAAEARRVPGVVALAANEGGITYAGAFGRRNIAQSEDMTLDTVFWVASMTKAVTSVAAMQLVEQGKLQLEAPLGETLPELRSARVLEGFDAAGNPRLRPPKRPITLRHLLTHTAGYSYDIWNRDIGRYMQQAGIPGIISCKNDALRTPLIADPGDRWEYGINVDWIGKAVEHVGGESLESYFRSHIFAPLGMADTGFRIGSGQRARLASMHARQADGGLQPIDFEIPQEPEFFMGGGGLYSTGPDYLRFVQMLLHRGRLEGAEVLRAETVSLMAENHIGDLTVGAMRTAMPESSTDAEFFPGMVKKWGLGFLINTEDAPTGRRAGSLTWAGLGNTYFWIDPRQRIGGVILMQVLPFADADCLRLYGEFERAVYNIAGAA